MNTKFQLGHGLSAMETAAIFRHLQLSKKSRFWRVLLTYYYSFTMLTFKKGAFDKRRPLAHPQGFGHHLDAPKQKSSSTHPSGPDGPQQEGACSPEYKRSMS
jgi:hypothetical protein